mmetsp:Transcript_125112/g.267048  ORF Transcript_125112/g.267048 Transcript_125112/m.267048 type:complete len:284 (+) Transcript_125112:171-1022(+)
MVDHARMQIWRLALSFAEQSFCNAFMATSDFWAFPAISAWRRVLLSSKELSQAMKQFCRKALCDDAAQDASTFASFFDCKPPSLMRSARTASFMASSTATACRACASASAARSATLSRSAPAQATRQRRRRLRFSDIIQQVTILSEYLSWIAPSRCCSVRFASRRFSSRALDHAAMHMCRLALSFDAQNFDNACMAVADLFAFSWSPTSRRMPLACTSPCQALKQLRRKPRSVEEPQERMVRSKRIFCIAMFRFRSASRASLDLSMPSRRLSSGKERHARKQR